jgi:hypothetical protein
MELLNVRFSFLCRYTRTNEEGKHPIVLRIILRSERRDIFTGLYCHKTEWNSKALRLHRLNKTCGAINDNLDLIQRKAHEDFQQLKYAGTAFTIDELVSKIRGEEHRYHQYQQLHSKGYTARRVGKSHLQRRAVYVGLSLSIVLINRDASFNLN